MFATYRRIKTLPGQSAEVGRLIESEYLPLIKDTAGYVSYTLVDLGNDEVCSIGVFSEAGAAETANETAHSWVSERLNPHVASALEAHSGDLLISHHQ